MKLTRIRYLGRYKYLINKRNYNIYIGQNVKRGTSHLFYFYRGKRIYINDSDFYSGNYQKIN